MQGQLELAKTIMIIETLTASLTARVRFSTLPRPPLFLNTYMHEFIYLMFFFRVCRHNGVALGVTLRFRRMESFSQHINVLNRQFFLHPKVPRKPYEAKTNA